MKIFAIIGLLFSAYCGMQVVAKWQYRNAIEKTLWFIAITVGGGYCLSVLFSRDNHQPITHPDLAKSAPVTPPWISNFLVSGPMPKLSRP
jgi:hypothetical protein